MKHCVILKTDNGQYISDITGGYVTDNIEDAFVFTSLRANRLMALDDSLIVSQNQKSKLANQCYEADISNGL